MTALHQLSTLDLAAAIRRREVSAVEVTEATLERATTAGAAVGAFAHVTPEFALAQAEHADAALSAARTDDERAALPPFLGVPVPIKDLNQMAGVPFEAGSAVLRGNVAAVDDGVVTLLPDVN